MGRRDSDPEGRRTFDVSVSCCSFHPSLPNFLLGRQLRKGGDGAQAIRARLAQGDGVDKGGITPPAGWRERYDQGLRDGAFGQADFVRCPYLSEERQCRIWMDRGAVCRTWFCAHDHGPRGARMWRAVRELLRAVERSLARRCEAAGNPPQDDAPSPEAWERWFVWCADYVDGLALEPAIESEIDEARNDLREAQATLVEAMPEVLAPALTEWHSGAEHAVVEGYSAYDTAEVPLPSLWLFLSLLDGTRPWQEAAEQAGISEVAARELHRIGALVPPGEGHRELQGSSLLRLRTRDGEWISVEPG